MKRIVRLVCVPAVCVLIFAASLAGQRTTAPGARSANPGDRTRITGVIKDPTGAVVSEARVELANSAAGFEAATATDRSGHFSFSGVPEGTYELRASAPGFDAEVVPALAVTGPHEVAVNLALHIASTRASIEVRAPLLGSSSETLVEPGLASQAQTANTAELLAKTPGVSVRENGTLGSIPMLHGLGDERTRLVVDGMTVSYSCPNHMNPPASYIAAAHTARMTVMPGITPVSLGGDSLGGTVAIESADPVFADGDERLRATVDASGFYRSNGDNYGGSFTEWISGHHLGLGYSGSWATNFNYEDGSGHKVTSTYAQTTEHALTLAARGGNNFIALRAGLHHVPYEGFPSAQMDMVRDYAESLNLHYRRTLEHGDLDARVYWQGTWHSMDIGKDKAAFPMPMWMPMNTHGRDYGYAWKMDLPIAARHNLAAGNEVHRFVLDDRWPAVPGTAPGMAPDDFISINHGHRMRMGWFAELTSEWTPRWTTLFGLRSDTVWMNTGAVHGYSMMYAADANAFNAASRARRDDDLDTTAWMRFQPNANLSFEAGHARKTRAPNLYERYAWSTSKMISGMIGWFGDGNYYVGSLALRPEAADTFGVTAAWHDSARANWDLKATSYVTALHDFVDVDTLKTYTYSKSTLAQLRFANHDARIAGVDLSGERIVWQNERLGLGRLAVVAGWQHGERTDSSTALYQMMPVHARFAFDEQRKGVTGGVALALLDRKSRLDPNRYEKPTSGYALLDVRGGFEHGHLRIAGGADNLLNRNYAPPLGGVNFDDFMASGRKTELNPLTGRGRTMYVALSAQF